MIRRLLAYGWPTVLVAAACTGLVPRTGCSRGHWFRVPHSPRRFSRAVALQGYRRLAWAAVALAVAGMWWGGRATTHSREACSSRGSANGPTALVAVTGPARHGRYSLRLPAEVRRFAGERIREPVLLELPDGRAPPQGALLELEALPVAPRGPETGFDERGWLARRGIHVVLQGRDPRIVGRRGGHRRRWPTGSPACRAHWLSAPAANSLRCSTASCSGTTRALDAELKARLPGLGSLPPARGQRSERGVHRAGACSVSRGWRASHARERTSAVLAAIGAYALAVGWQPSVVRAAVAGSLASLAWLASRPRDRWHFLALGALVLLAWNPATCRPGLSALVCSGRRDLRLGAVARPPAPAAAASVSAAVDLARGDRHLGRLRHGHEPDPVARLPPCAGVDGRRERTRRARRGAAPRPRSLRGGRRSRCRRPRRPRSPGSPAGRPRGSRSAPASSRASRPRRLRQAALLAVVGATRVLAVVVARLPRWRRRLALTVIGAAIPVACRRGGGSARAPP